MWLTVVRFGFDGVRREEEEKVTDGDESLFPKDLGSVQSHLLEHHLLHEEDVLVESASQVVDVFARGLATGRLLQVVPVPHQTVVTGADGRSQGLHRQLDLFVVGQTLFQLEENVEHGVPDSPLAHVVRVVKVFHLLQGRDQIEHLVFVGLLFALQKIHVLVVGLLEPIRNLNDGPTIQNISFAAFLVTTLLCVS